MMPGAQDSDRPARTDPPVMAGAGWMCVRIAASVTPVSRPGLARPTTGGAETGKDVGGRAKPGHDTVGTAASRARYVGAHRAWSGHDAVGTAAPQAPLSY